DELFRASSENGDRSRNAGLVMSKNTMKRVHIRHGVIAESDDNIAFAQACTLGRAVLFDSYDEYTGRHRQMVSTHEEAMQRRVLSGHTDVSAADLSIFDQAPRNKLCRIDRDCETDALRGQNDRGIDTDDLSPRRDQRPAGITGIKRSVRLNHVIDQAA